MTTRLLAEDGGHLLKEDGGRLLLEQSVVPRFSVLPFYSGGIPPTIFQDAHIAPVSRLTRRCEILNPDNTIWMSSDVTELLATGSVTSDISRDERRGVDCSLRYGSIIANDKNLWYDKRVRLWRGIDAGSDGTWETPLGTFMPDKIDLDPIGRTVHITGRDLTKLLINDHIDEAVTYVAGTDAIEIIRAEATLAGIRDMVLPTDAYPLVADLTYDADTSRWDIIKGVATALGLEVFFDSYAYLVVRTLQDPFTSPSTFTFQTGKNLGNLVDFVKTLDDSLLFNKVVVRGESDTTIPAQGFAEVTNPASPIHWTRIGRRSTTFSSPLVTTDAQATALAAQLLKSYALSQFAISLDSIAIPWLEAGNVVDFLDPDPDYAGDPTRYLLQSFSIGLDLSPMSAQVGRVVTLL